MRQRAAAWIRRRQGEDTLPLTLQRRRLYILPTRAGAGFATLLLFMLVAGLNYGNSFALFLTFLLAGFVLVVMNLCHRNLLGTAVQTAQATASVAGGTGIVHLTLQNPAAAPRYRLEAQIAGQPTDGADLTSSSSENLTLTVPTPVRGKLMVDRIRVTTTHPFGLFRAWTWIHAPIEMVVYPRPRGSAPMPNGGAHVAGQLSRPEIGADQWQGLRPFRDGDSPRQVDWKAYAREAPLLVKEYESPAGLTRLFEFRSLFHLDVEARLEQLARWIVDAEAAGQRYGLELPGTRIDPASGAEHRHRCLAALALFGSRADDAAAGERH